MKEKFIEVYDGIFPEGLLNSLESILFDSKSPINYDLTPNFTFNPGLTNLNSKDYGVSWVNVINKDFKSPNSSFYLQPLYHFCTYKNLILMDIINARGSIQIPSNLDYTPPPHYDCLDPNKNSLPNIDILLIYLNNSDGDTVLYDEDQKTEIKRVSPKRGRSVYFSNQLLHRSSLPKNLPRAVINYNFLTHPFYE